MTNGKGSILNKQSFLASLPRKRHTGKNSYGFPMFEILALLCLVAAPVLLVALSVIDLKHWILPDELNLALGVTGVAFHMLTAYRFFDIQDMLAGAALGAGLLYVIRFFANRHYDRDTLGLGDVKLLGAAGLWLGLEGTLQAITLGAFAGLLHGIVYAFYLSRKNNAPMTLTQLSIPAGPGFAVGILLAGYFLFSPYIKEAFDGFTT
jgi:leader peptidase (prepilin peptidase)/N-methyltransferase